MGAGERVHVDAAGVVLAELGYLALPDGAAERRVGSSRNLTGTLQPPTGQGIFAILRLVTGDGGTVEFEDDELGAGRDTHRHHRRGQPHHRQTPLATRHAHSYDRHLQCALGPFLAQPRALIRLAVTPGSCTCGQNASAANPSSRRRLRT